MASREAKFSTEFEFGSLVRYNWAQNSETSKTHHFVLFFMSFLRFFEHSSF